MGHELHEVHGIRCSVAPGHAKLAAGGKAGICCDFMPPDAMLVCRASSAGPCANLATEASYSEAHTRLPVQSLLLPDISCSARRSA